MCSWRKCKIYSRDLNSTSFCLGTHKSLVDDSEGIGVSFKM